MKITVPLLKSVIELTSTFGMLSEGTVLVGRILLDIQSYHIFGMLIMGNSQFQVILSLCVADKFQVFA